MGAFHRERLPSLVARVYVVPTGGDTVKAAWIFLAVVLAAAVAYAARAPYRAEAANWNLCGGDE